MTGLIVALVVNFWQAIGSLLYRPTELPKFPLGVDCSVFIDPNATLPAAPEPETSAAVTLADVMGTTTGSPVTEPVPFTPP